MGSLANFHCSYLCCTINHSVPKSDLFVPQFDAKEDSQKNNKKKLLKTTIMQKNNMVINNITTERFILSKPRIRNSYTVNSKRIFQKNKIELHRNFTKNNTTIKKMLI